MSKVGEKQTYHGNCHCGAFKFSVALAPIRKAARLPEKPSDFKVEAGEGTLKSYTFGNGVAEHKVSEHYPQSL
ncbi:hypothetical protein E4T44_01979 [Aureobasidium sp. EXF-8845]|nr:hypothetical protein E4T44_01979 [Aureobasidium sp. EXF-8845]KAI4852980.1 hypothetical protein E4T45_04514 [Aureobasidium sp. EXF-8846]